MRSKYKLQTLKNDHEQVAHKSLEKSIELDVPLHKESLQSLLKGDDEN